MGLGIRAVQLAGLVPMPGLSPSSALLIIEHAPARASAMSALPSPTMPGPLVIR